MEVVSIKDIPKELEIVCTECMGVKTKVIKTYKGSYICEMCLRKMLKLIESDDGKSFKNIETFFKTSDPKTKSEFIESFDKE